MGLWVLGMATADMKKMDQGGGMSLLEHHGLLVAMRRGLFRPRTEERSFGTARTLARHLRSQLYYCLVGVHRAQCGMNSHLHPKLIHLRM